MRFSFHSLVGAAGLFLLSLPPANTLVSAEERIELSDGSVIHGKMRSFSGGVYTIDARQGGTLRLPRDRIQTFQRIENAQVVSQSADPKPVPNAGDPTLHKLQERMMQDPETVRMIQNLQNDPQMQKILQDPELMRAVQQGDVNRLMQDPKFMELMNNKTVGEIIQKNQAP